MGIKQRREREKQEVRQGILTAAREIARQEGWQSVTIRKVAERIEYSPPTIYEYFESKEDILLELLREGFRQIAATLKAVREVGEDPEQRLLNMVEAYWNFAMSNPELYQVMNGLGGVPFDCLEKPPAAREAFVTTQGALLDWARAKGVDIPDIEGAVEIIRSLVHGLISLTMVDRIDGGEPRAKELVQRAMRDMFAAWSARQKE
ncbi:MAG TPA: TetR/AcrR family transcriptional regulator [Ktedonobacteraceae bacterium]